MKTALVLLFLALFAAVYAAPSCNPDGDGMPDCTGRSGQVSRDFWDPTHYWQCGDTGTPELVACPQNTGFDPKIGDCISWKTWEWVPPCPEVTA